MGLTVQLEDEKGKVLQRVDDMKNVLGRVLPGPSAEDFPYLRYVDPYGDTIFNRLQIGPFLTEWDVVASRVNKADERAILDRIRLLAETCAGEQHCYLRFVGD